MADMMNSVAGIAKVSEASSSVVAEKFDFYIIFDVNMATLNGDPDAEARPRVDDNNYGLASDVCFKHKIRNYLAAKYDAKDSILMLSTDDCEKGFNTVAKRIDMKDGLTDLLKSPKISYAERRTALCDNFLDVKYFGATVAIKDIKLGIRGPVTMQWAKTVAPVVVLDNGITKCISLETADKKGPDTMGSKSFVKHGLYVLKGSISGLMAEQNGLTGADIEKFKDALLHMFDCDESASRPAGSCKVVKAYWWEHGSKLGCKSSADVFDTVHIKCNSDDPTSFADYEVTVDEGLEGYPKLTVLK